MNGGRRQKINRDDILNVGPVLVTGASGFIGRHLCRRFDSLGAQIHGLTRNLDHTAPGDGVRWWQADLCDREKLKRVINEVRPRRVVHLAGYVTSSPALSNVFDTLEHNLVGTVNLMCELALVGCDRVIITGSSEELTFESGAGGLSPYAATKTAIGIYSRLFSANYGLPVVTARLFHVFGPGQREDKLIPYVIRSFASGMQPRLGACRRICDLVFVEDVVEALVCLVQKPTIPGGQLDIGTGVGSTLRDVVLGIKCMMDSNIEPVFATRTEDSRCPQIANSPRTTELLGWTAKTLVPDGLVKTIKYERHAMATLASAHRGI